MRAGYPLRELDDSIKTPQGGEDKMYDMIMIALPKVPNTPFTHRGL